MDRGDAESICICPECPTYVACGESVAFCLYPGGSSSCIAEEKGCICGGCPVHDLEEFVYGYYCTQGSEVAQESE